MSNGDGLVTPGPMMAPLRWRVFEPPRLVVAVVPDMGVDGRLVRGVAVIDIDDGLMPIVVV
jgi:hypothetical protein